MNIFKSKKRYSLKTRKAFTNIWDIWEENLTYRQAKLKKDVILKNKELSGWNIAEAKIEVMKKEKIAI